MSDWNAKLYSKYEQERTQPAIDLINSIRIKSPQRILDVGCGPGNSTEQLSFKWNDAEIVGIDSSKNMLSLAKQRLANIKFHLQDASKDLSSFGKFDIIFSNAVIQWIPDQTSLIKNLYSMLNTGGVLAMQIPNVTNMAINKVVSETVSSEKWKNLLSNNISLVMNDIKFYYSICAEISNEFNLWITDYYHVMDNHKAILLWYKSAGLKPYLEQLETSLHEEFEKDILNKIYEHYEAEPDGKVLFPFTRQFVTIYK